MFMCPILTGLKKEKKCVPSPIDSLLAFLTGLFALREKDVLYSQTQGSKINVCVRLFSQGSKRCRPILKGLKSRVLIFNSAFGIFVLKNGTRAV